MVNIEQAEAIIKYYTESNKLPKNRVTSIKKIRNELLEKAHLEKTHLKPTKEVKKTTNLDKSKKTSKKEENQEITENVGKFR